MKSSMKSFAFTALRLVLSFLFLWAFVDKLFGFGMTTPHASAWIRGRSPTGGFLAAAVHGPFAGFFHTLAHHGVIDWIFMMGLLGIGLALLTGIWIRLAAILGAVLMVVVFLSRIPPDNNPLFDEHIVYALVLLLIAGSAHKRALTPASASGASADAA